MLVLLFAGPSMFGIGYNLIKTPLYNEDGTPSYHLQHNTLMFQTFMMMNLFNMFNCRVLESKGEPQWNVLDGIWRNWWFLIIWFAELNMQIFMVGYADFGMIFQTTPLLSACTLPLSSSALAPSVLPPLSRRLQRTSSSTSRPHLSLSACTFPLSSSALAPSVL